MENMELAKFYKGKKVLITGHTGFKGSWLTLLMDSFGAKVSGFSIDIPTTPSLFELCKLESRKNIQTIYGDISNYQEIEKAIKLSEPDIVFHLAAHSIVIDSYINPLDAIKTNVLGTANLLKACSESKTVKSIINVTTDKCYKNKNWEYPYREIDELGGNDPYSASKAAVEIVSHSLYVSLLKSKKIGMSTVRAGNVIGGGDFSNYRLIPDIVRATENNTPLKIRHPKSVRPWQYVIDVLKGYCIVGMELFKFPEKYSTPYNLSVSNSVVPVDEVIERFLALSSEKPDITYSQNNDYHEEKLLLLDSSKIKAELGWESKLSFEDAIKETAFWYETYRKNKEYDFYKESIKYIERFFNDPKN
jgi:CDP-glucose 4,6-dehydratase